MDLELAEAILRRAGGLLAFTALAVVFYGTWRGTRRPSGRTSGLATGWLRWLILYSLRLSYCAPATRNWPWRQSLVTNGRSIASVSRFFSVIEVIALR
jgi:hypothetical protein